MRMFSFSAGYGFWVPKPLSVDSLVACVERIAGVQLVLTTEAEA